MIEYGEFCRVYGATLRNRVIEYMLERGRLDFAVGDLAQEVNLSRPRAYQLIKELSNEGIIKKTRLVGRTQLYTLDYSNSVVKLLKKSFNDCLRLVENTVSNPIKELSEKYKDRSLPKSYFIKIQDLFERASLK